MALHARIHFKTFVRTDKNPNVRSEDWARIFGPYQPGLNFDGELWGLGHQIDELVEAGFRGPGDPSSECCWNSNVKGYANWLTKIRVIPKLQSIEPFDAWTIRGSTCNFVQCQWSETVLINGINSEWDFAKY